MTMYTAAYNREPQKLSPASAVDESKKKNKVDTVCDAVREQLEKTNTDK